MVSPKKIFLIKKFNFVSGEKPWMLILDDKTLWSFTTAVVFLGKNIIYLFYI